MSGDSKGALLSYWRPTPRPAALLLLRTDAELMAREAGKGTYTDRIFPVRPLRSLSPRAVARWLVIAFCLLAWIAIIITFFF